MPTITEYVDNLNEDGVYIDPVMNSFVTSIEPLVQKLKHQQSINKGDIVEEYEKIEFSEIQLFLDRAESIFNNLIEEEEKNKFLPLETEKTTIMTDRMKQDFIEEINNYLKDRPMLQSFLDGVQELIIKYKVRGKKYSLGDYKKFKPRSIANDELNMEFDNWDEFAINITDNEFTRNVLDQQEEKQHIKYLNEVDDLLEYDEPKMIGNFNNNAKKFVKSLETLPIRSQSEEEYALTKLVKEMDEKYQH